MLISWLASAVCFASLSSHQVLRDTLHANSSALALLDSISQYAFEPVSPGKKLSETSSALLAAGKNIKDLNLDGNISGLFVYFTVNVYFKDANEGDIVEYLKPIPTLFDLGAELIVYLKDIKAFYNEILIKIKINQLLYIQILNKFLDVYYGIISVLKGVSTNDPKDFYDFIPITRTIENLKSNMEMKEFNLKLWNELLEGKDRYSTDKLKAYFQQAIYLETLFIAVRIATEIEKLPKTQIETPKEKMAQEVGTQNISKESVLEQDELGDSDSTEIVQEKECNSHAMHSDEEEAANNLATKTEPIPVNMNLTEEYKAESISQEQDIGHIDTEIEQANAKKSSTVFIKGDKKEDIVEDQSEIVRSDSEILTFDYGDFAQYLLQKRLPETSEAASLLEELRNWKSPGELSLVFADFKRVYTQLETMPLKPHELFECLYVIAHFMLSASHLSYVSDQIVEEDFMEKTMEYLKISKQFVKRFVNRESVYDVNFSSTIRILFTISIRVSQMMNALEPLDNETPNYSNPLMIDTLLSLESDIYQGAGDIKKLLRLREEKNIFDPSSFSGQKETVFKHCLLLAAMVAEQIERSQKNSEDSKSSWIAALQASNETVNSSRHQAFLAFEMFTVQTSTWYTFIGESSSAISQNRIDAAETVYRHIKELVKFHEKHEFTAEIVEYYQSIEKAAEMALIQSKAIHDQITFYSEKMKQKTPESSPLPISPAISSTPPSEYSRLEAELKEDKNALNLLKNVSNYKYKSSRLRRKLSETLKHLVQTCQKIQNLQFNDVVYHQFMVYTILTYLKDLTEEDVVLSLRYLKREKVVSVESLNDAIEDVAYFVKHATDFILSPVSDLNIETSQYMEILMKFLHIGYGFVFVTSYVSLDNDFYAYQPVIDVLEDLPANIDRKEFHVDLWKEIIEAEPIYEKGTVAGFQELTFNYCLFIATQIGINYEPDQAGDRSGDQGYSLSSATALMTKFAQYTLTSIEQAHQVAYSAYKSFSIEIERDNLDEAVKHASIIFSATSAAKSGIEALIQAQAGAQRTLEILQARNLNDMNAEISGAVTVYSEIVDMFNRFIEGTYKTKENIKNMNDFVSLHHSKLDAFGIPGWINVTPRNL
jgi:hypothetical protein